MGIKTQNLMLISIPIQSVVDTREIDQLQKITMKNVSEKEIDGKT
jgi:hypothetical protein